MPSEHGSGLKCLHRLDLYFPSRWKCVRTLAFTHVVGTVPPSTVKKASPYLSALTQHFRIYGFPPPTPNNSLTLAGCVLTGFSHLLEHSWNSGTWFTNQVTSYCKEYSSGTVREERLRARYGGEGVRGSRAGYTTAQAPLCVHQPGSSPGPMGLGILILALHRVGMTDYIIGRW